MEVGGLGINSAALTPVSGYINVGTPIVTSAFVSANYAVTAGQAINFDTVLFDTASGVIQTSGMILVGAANAWKFVAPITGTYRMTVIAITTGGTGDLALYKNGSSLILMGSLLAGDRNSSSALVQLNAGNFISANSVAGLTVVGTGVPYASSIYIELIR